MSAAADVPADVMPAPERKAVDLSALGALTLGDIQDTAYARILVLGPPKRGKTTAILQDAPDPYVINCDANDPTDSSAIKYALKCGAQPVGVSNVTDRASWGKALRIARAGVANGEGPIRTVLIDSLTLLADNLIDEIGQHLKGYDKWGELATQLVGGVKAAFSLKAHVILVAHMVPSISDDDGNGEGIVPLIGGQAKIKIPAIAHDCVLFDYVHGRNPERMFLIGPQGDWNYAGRNVKRSCAVPANCEALFAELGIAL